MAEGIRADGAKELRRVIDHLTSNVHRASEKQSEMQRLWEAESEKHPWVRVLKTLETQTFNTLVELAIDVYNESRIKHCPPIRGHRDLYLIFMTPIN